jgi:NodT family efflux transporter outer membrane factor (OMF) lipoprotein
LAGLTLVACTAGPDFVRPDLPDSDAYYPGSLVVETARTDILHGHSQRMQPAESLDGAWWLAFQSPRLAQLIDLALADSPTLDEAFSRVREADALYDAKNRGVTFPRLTGQATGERTNGVPGTATDPSGEVVNREGASLLGSFRLDLAGKTRRELEALAARADTRHYEALAARRDLAHRLVGAAIQQARLVDQLRVENVRRGAYDELLSLTLERVRLGHATQADVHAVQRDLRLSEQTVATLETDIEVLGQRLAVLAGQEPSSYRTEPFTLDDFQLPETLPLVVPSALVRTRPDILAAETLLEAATADYGVAVASLYPEITLSASTGAYQLGEGGLFSGTTQAWNLLAQLTAPLLDGELRGMKRVRLAAVDAAAAHYRGTVLSALGDVAETLKRADITATNLTLANDAYKDSVIVVESLRTRQEHGALSRADLLPEYIAFVDIEARVINAMSDRLLATADIMRAMTDGEFLPDQIETPGGAEGMGRALVDPALQGSSIEGHSSPEGVAP